MTYLPGWCALVGVGMLVATVSMPCSAFAECKEFKMEEFADRIEVVCVGEPLTAAELKARAEEDKRQEQEARRLKAEDDKRQKDAESVYAKNKAQEEAAKKKQGTRPVPPVKPFDASKNLPVK